MKPALRSLGLENRATIFQTCPNASARPLADRIAQVKPALRSLGLENRAIVAQLSELRERRKQSSGALTLSNVPQRFRSDIGR